MKPEAKNYKFRLYEDSLSDELLIQKIRNAISALPATLYSFVIVDLFKMDENPGIPFFQIAHDREFKKTDLYHYDIRLNYISDGKLKWKIYGKSHQTKQQALSAFEEICVKRITPDLADWDERDIGSDIINPREKNLKLLKNLYSDYFSISSPTEFDNIKYLESLLYVVNYSNGYIGDEALSLIDEYCNRGKYNEAKEALEYKTYVPKATFKLANMIISGKLGKPDYKLAYEYYKHTCIIDPNNYLGAKVEIAKMHRDGQYFKPDYQIYKRMIRSIEKEFLKCGGYYPNLDKLYYELALIEQADGNLEKVIDNCFNAFYWIKAVLACGNPLEEYILSAKRILKLLFSLIDFDATNTSFYYLIHILDAPLKIIFMYKDNVYEIESFIDEDDLIIKFNDKYYVGSVNFLLKARLGGKHLLKEAKNITVLEVLQ